MTVQFQSALMQNIRRRRVELGIPQYDFAVKVGMSKRAWHYVEKEVQGLTLQKLVAVAAALKVPISILTYDVEHFLEHGEFPPLPVNPKPLEKKHAAKVSELRRRNPTWCSALSTELCEADQG
jgi:transcriptional regulator with XRE-family HTH domain